MRKRISTEFLQFVLYVFGCDSASDARPFQGHARCLVTDGAGSVRSEFRPMGVIRENIEYCTNRYVSIGLGADSFLDPLYWGTKFAKPIESGSVLSRGVGSSP